MEETPIGKTEAANTVLRVQRRMRGKVCDDAAEVDISLGCETNIHDENQGFAGPSV